MRVLFINTVYGKGSTGKIIKDLGNSIAESGGEFCVAFGRGECDESVNSYRIGEKKDYISHALLSRITDRSGFYSSEPTKKLVEFIKQYDPDIIHLHNLHGYYLNIKILFEYLKNEFKGKTVWTIHDCWAFTGHCPHFAFKKCNKWQTECFKCPEKNGYPKSLLADCSKRNYLEKKELYTGLHDLTVVTVSDWLKGVTERSILGSYPVKRIYNGVDLNKFKPTVSDVRKKYNCENKKLIFLVSDGWNERKGYSKLIKIAKKSPEAWQYIMVGLDKGKIAELPRNVIGLERTWNQQELIELYSAADLFLNPSVEETFGLVTVEAMACGTPVVLVNSTASPELIKTEGSGLICEINASVDEMLDIIAKGLTLKENGGNISARKNAEIYSVQKHNEEYIRLYSNLIGEI